MIKKLLLFIFPIVLFAKFGSFLSPEEAFKVDARVLANQDIKVTIHIAKDTHIYQDKTKFDIADKSIDLKLVHEPKAKDLEGEKVIYGDAVYILRVIDKSNIKGEKDINLSVTFQGCSDRGLCYQPITNTFGLKIDTSKLKKQSSAQNKTSKKVESKNEVDSIASTIKEGNLIVIIATFFVFGLMLALTPCVFPMIPIISGLIVSQGEGVTTKKAFMLSLVYVLFMALAYTIAGVLAGLFGSNLQATLQNPYVVISFSAVFVALALSMFGLYELKLPDKFVSKVSSVGQDKGGYIGVAIMGFLSALIVGPCVAAPLAGALVYIGQTGDAILGAIALFAMSMGMGLPLILVGVGSKKLMPKPGPWMTLVNVTFGLIMLGVAIWMLEKIAPAYIIMILWAILALGASLVYGAFDSDTHPFKRTIAFTLFIYALALFIGAFSGSTSYTTPLDKIGSTSQVVSTKKETQLEFRVIHSIEELDKVLKDNKGKKVLVDFSAKWCTSCKEYEEITFKDTNVVSKMKEFVLVRADMSANSDKEKALAKKYGVFGPPVIIFFNEEGKWLKDKTIVGYLEPKRFLDALNSL